MATFNNGESGSSVRAKINAVLQHADGTAGEIVFNDAGADVDFRIESDTNANAFFMDGATGNVGLGTSSPASSLDVASAASDAVASLTAAGVQRWQLKTERSTGNFLVYNQTGTSTPITLTATGNLGVGTTSPQNRMTVSGSTSYLSVLNTAAGSAASPSFSGIRFYGFAEAASGLVASVEAGNSQTSDFAGILRFSTQPVSGGGPLERMRIDASGNLGLGVTPSAWGSAYKALDISNNYAVYNNGGGGTGGTASNALHNGTNWVYKTTNPATRYQQEVIGGLHTWFTAPSGTAGAPITFTQAMTLNASGSLGIGTTSPSTIYTRTAHISSAGASGVVFTNTITPKTYAIGTNGTILQFYDVTAGAERMQIDSNGNLGIGVAPTGASKLRISGLPTSSAGLSAGDVWNDGGTLKIV